MTGATGFIGSWLVEELINNKIYTTIIVRNVGRILPSWKNNKYCKIVESSWQSIDEKNFEQLDYDVFYHLAWGGVAPESKNDIEIQFDNIKMSIKMLELANKLGCKKFVAAGTVAEYVFCQDVMNVNEKQTPNDMYGAAKVSTHYFLEVRARQLGQPFNWMVIPSTFGERRMDNNIITYTIKTLLKGDKPQYGALEQMWDFLYVGEVVRAIRLIGEKGVNDKIYGIGSGQYRPLKSYIQEIRDIIDPTLALGIGEIPSFSEKTFSSCVNTYDLVLDTGFVPYISFGEGIRKTIDYFQNMSV